MSNSNAKAMRGIEARKKRLDALRLRMAGATYDQICNAVGYKSRGAAHKAIATALSEAHIEAGEEFVKIQHARYNDLLNLLYPRVVKGDLKATAQYLNTLERMERLYGIGKTPVFVFGNGSGANNGAAAPIAEASEIEIGEFYRQFSDPKPLEGATNILEAEFVDIE